MKLQKLRENQRSHRIIEDDYGAEFGDIGGSSPTNRMKPPMARNRSKYGAKANNRASHGLGLQKSGEGKIQALGLIKPTGGRGIDEDVSYSRLHENAADNKNPTPFQAEDSRMGQHYDEINLP